MAEQLLHRDRVEFEAPPYGGSFIFQMVVLGFASLGLQIGLFWFATGGMISQGIGPVTAGPLNLKPNLTVLPGSTAVCRGEVWVSVVAGTPPNYGSPNVRPVSSRLMALDVQTGFVKETNITLSPSPTGLLTVDDQLWCVAETVVYRIENGEAIPRYPRRSLIQPSKPFLYSGRLAVIDKNRNDVASLLTWDDGEWKDEGPIDVPIPQAARWFSPELRVVSNGTTTFVFFTDGPTILYREGFQLNPVSASPVEPKPASALHPENDQAAMLTSMMATQTSIGIPQHPGWKGMPISNNWGTTWEVAVIHDELWAFFHTGPYRDTKVEQYRMQNGNWVNATPKFPPEMRGFGVAGGPTGYLVSNDLSLFQVKSSSLERVTTGTPMSERFRSVLIYLKTLGLYLLATGGLILGAWRLMQIHRKRGYVYGKRSVIHASILRRGIARGIDFLLTVFPAYFWFSVMLSEDVMIPLQQQSATVGIVDPFFFMLLSILGLWLGTTLILCYGEGNWGFTPGKWLLGIRTLRTTLRPCGMLRSFARELLVYVDGLFFLTWLPGVLLIALTPHWQRLGDLTADTVVVNESGSSSNW